MDINGKLNFYKIEIKQRNYAVYYDIFFIDETEKIFKAHSSHFLFDLEYISNLLLNSNYESK